jgi:hypothetical protein
MTELVKEAIPHWQWWANWGVLGVLASIAVLVCLIALREWWKVKRPYVIKRLEIELAKEAKTVDLLDTLRVCQVADQDHKQRQLALTESVVASQRTHAEDCASSREILGRIARHLEVE